MTHQSELRAEILDEFNTVLRLAPSDYTENCTNIVMNIVDNYITANYTPNTEVAERESVAAIKAQLGMIEYYDQVPNNKDMDWKGLFSDNRKHLEDALTKAKEQPNDPA